METTITKLEAAQTLLDRALTVFLDHDDYVSTIVLAGAAEDVLEGLLHQAGEGKNSSRNQFADATAKMVAKVDKSRDPISPGFAVKMMRDMYNWLRHANDPKEPQTAQSDLDEEAQWMIIRATDNFIQVSHSVPVRMPEFEARRRRSRPAAETEPTSE